MRKLLQWSWWTGSVSRRIGVITVLTLALTAAVAFVSLRGLHVLNSELDRTVREQSQAVPGDHPLVIVRRDEQEEANRTAHRDFRIRQRSATRPSGPTADTMSIGSGRRIRTARRGR